MRTSTLNQTTGSSDATARKNNGIEPSPENPHRTTAGWLN
jgi:hypothetical protein